MKTREIKCKVSSLTLDDIEGACLYAHDTKCEDDFLEATLIVRIPEKKITITESDFDCAMEKVIENFPNNYTASKRALTEIKEELGLND